VSTLGSGFALHVEDAVCVRSDTLATGWLQDALLAQGLNITEATEMATHWLPQMVEQSYVLISFVPKCILDRHAPLAISPTPQLLHRVFMLFSPVDIPPPTARSAVIPPPVDAVPSPAMRPAYTVVEWGGMCAVPLALPAAWFSDEQAVDKAELTAVIQDADSSSMIASISSNE